jgi:hypothetical protein
MRAWHGSEPVSLIESHSLIVLGIDHKHWRGNVGLQTPHYGIGQHRLTQAAPPKPMIDSKAANPNCRHHGISREVFYGIRRKIGKWNAGGGESVITHKVAAGEFDSYKAVRDQPSDILGDLDLEVTIQRFLAAMKCGALMLDAERFDAKRKIRHSKPNSSRRRRKALRSAGVGSGGFKSISASCR